MQKPTKKVAPDGGWGWAACFGVSLVNVSIFEHFFVCIYFDLKHVGAFDSVEYSFVH